MNAGCWLADTDHQLPGASATYCLWAAAVRGSKSGAACPSVTGGCGRFPGWMLMVQLLASCSRRVQVLIWAPGLSLLCLLDQNWGVWWTKGLIPRWIFVNLPSFRQERAQTLRQAEPAEPRGLSELRASATGRIYLSVWQWKTEQKEGTESWMDPIMWPLMTFIWSDTSGSAICGWLWWLMLSDAMKKPN